LAEETGRGDGGRFLPGQAPRSPGRPKGARAKLGEAFLEALAADFELYGVETIQKTRTIDPAAYVKIIAGILPKELAGEGGGPILQRIERVIIDPSNKDS
jgi:hypothetical protein